MWQNDENKMESNQGWNIPNRGDERNGAQQQQQQIETDNDKMGLDSFDELLGAIGGRDNSLNFMNAGSNMTSNNSNSDNGNRSFNNNGSNCDDGGNGQHFSNYNYYSGTSFNNNGERSQDRLNKNNEGWPSIGSQRGDNGNNSGNSSSNAIGNNSGWGCVSQQLHQNQQGFQQQQQKKQSNNNNNNSINSNQSNNSGVSLSGWGDPSNVSKAPNNSNWLNENNNSNNNQDANNNSDNNNGGGGGIHRIRENDYSSYGSQQKENSTLTMAVIEGENKPVKSDYIKPALLSDNWGKTVINQDKAWDLPPSPQSSPNESSAVWTNSSTTGTEIWENAVRNKTKASISAASDAATSGAVAGATSANQKSSQPWGHTLSTHIGGTWGEEEDSSNVWTGVPPVGPSPVAMGAGTGTITSILNSAVNANNHSIPSESNSCSDNGTSLWGSSTKANSSGVLATANAVNALNTGGVGNFGGPIANNANMNIVNSSVVGGDIIKQRGDNIMNPMINSSNSNNNNNNNNNSNINNNSNNINLNNSNNVNMMKSSCSSSTSSGSGSSNIGTWGTLPATSLNKGEVIQPTGWDTEEENAAKRIPPVASGNFDDGTAVWGKPEQHNKIARWKETANAKAGNSANANNAPSSQTNMNSGISNITSPSPGMIRLPPGTSGLNSSNTNIMNNAINDQNKLANGNLMHDGGDISDVSNSGMGGMLNNPNVMGTDIWGKPVTNRNWNDSQSSLNMNNKSNPMPIGGGGGGWGAKQSDSGTPKTPGTPNTPGSNIGGGWGSDGGPTSPHAYWGSKGRNGGGNNWLAGDEPIEAGGNWNKPKQAQQPQQMSKEMLASSKVYRLLMEMGCKKEDIENALRSSGLKKEELNDLARAFSMRDNMNEIDLRGKGSMVSSNTPTSLLLNSGLVNSSLSSIMNRNPSQGMQQAQPQATLSSHQTQDHLANVQQSSSQQHDQSQIHHQLNQAPSQALPSINHVQNVLRNQAAKNIGSGQPTLPSEKQLMHLVQQIQLAVQSGHLNAQILNQPLALPTIHLINQLLQNIKTLQQLQMQIATHSKNGGPLNNSSQSNLHVQITQTKLRISNLQNQINIQQALFLKQQQQQGQMSGGPIHSQTNVGMSQGSAANQSPLIYSQTNGDIGGNGGAQNQSQHQIPPNIHSSSHAQGVLHSNLVSSTGNSNPSVPQVFNHNHGGNGNGAGMDFLKDGEAMQLNSDFRDLWCVLKDFGGAQSGMHPIPGLATSMAGTHGIINSMSNSSHQGHHQQQTQQGPHQSQHQQQSRLKSWKFSNFDRDDHSGSGNTNNNDFLRAPGSSKHQQIVESVSNMARNSDNSSIGSGSSLSLVGGGNDSPTWSKDSIMNNVSSSVPSSVMGPNVTQSGDLKGLIMSSSSSASGGVMTASSQSAVNNLDLNNINNLVPEFEPGKPWKGVSGMKIEDDPHITPGSIARSPLSVNTVRDPALIPGLYNNWSTKGANPTTVNSDIMAPAAVGLSSSTTWAFNPNANTGWGAIPNESTNSETLWSGSMTKTRGPPPGLGQERVAPRGNQALAGIRPQSNSYGNWMANPSNDGGDHLANRGLESKDMLFSRMMNNSNGMGFGMGVNIGNKWM